MAEIIPSGTVQADSADFTLAAGASTTIGIFNAEAVSLPDICLAQIQRKGSNGVYTALGQGLGNLDWQVRERVIAGPGTFRVRKFATAVAFGVDRD